jgi:hypothetical protein
MPHLSCWMPSPPGTTWRCSGRCRTPIYKWVCLRYANLRGRRTGAVVIVNDSTAPAQCWACHVFGFGQRLPGLL